MPSSWVRMMGGDGRRGRTRTDNHWFWRPELCQIELRASAGSLLRLPVEGMTAVTRTILPKLEPARIVLLVLARGVGPLLALGAGKEDDRPVLWSCHVVLLGDRGDRAGADGPATFADGEAQADLEGDRGDQLDGHRDVVAGHDHLGAFGQPDRAGDV